MIKLLLVDCDGVLTDGMYNTSEMGTIFKTFFSRDFHGMHMLNKSGVDIVIVTTASDNVILHQCKRAAPYVIVYKEIEDKLDFVDRHFVKHENYDWSEIAFMGDDTFDLPLLKSVGLPACPSDADKQVSKFIFDMSDDGFISLFPGGRGAVREFSDYISKGISN